MVRVQIDGVGHRGNGPLYELEDATEEFLTAVRRALFKLEKEDGDGRAKITLDVSVIYDTPTEVVKC